MLRLRAQAGLHQRLCRYGERFLPSARQLLRTYAEIANTGHVGCANCYQLFADRLNPSIVRIHGNAAHCGKHSKITAQAREERAETKEDKIKRLQSQLDEAIKQQEFERAAELRDQIREMEGQK